MMGLGKRSKICSVAAVLLLVPQMAFAEEWWKDSFASEGSAPCDNNDSIVTFTDKAVEMWEVGCTLDKIQKINRLDVVILDMPKKPQRPHRVTPVELRALPDHLVGAVVGNK